MMKIPTTIPPRGFYYHYKHDPNGPVDNYAYEVMGVGCHTEDDCRPEDANLVVYRPLGMFMEDVTKDGKTFPRFRKIEDSAVIAELEGVKKRMYEE